MMERIENESPILMLVDPVWRFCGYVPQDQIASIPEASTIEGGVCHLANRPTSGKRTALLKCSLNVDSLTSSQRANVESELRFIRNQGRYSSLIMRPQGDERLVTRDRCGNYLGIWTERGASERWMTVKRLGWILLVDEPVKPMEVRRAQAAGEPPSTLTIGRSPRVRSSISAAIAFSTEKLDESTDALTLEDHSKPFEVFVDDEVPAWHATIAQVREAMESAWFIISNDAIQLVTGWDADAIDDAFILAGGTRGKRDGDSPTPGTPHMKEDNHIARKKPNRASQRLSQQAWKEIWTTRSATRDQRGCFLGVFGIDEAIDIWPNAVVAGAMIVVPSTIEFIDAADAIDRVTDWKTTFTQKRFKDSVSEASGFAARHVGIEAEEFWKAAMDRPVDVVDSGRNPIAKVTPRMLQEKLGDGWFLVTDELAQVMTTHSAGWVRSALREVSEDFARPKTDLFANVPAGSRVIFSASGAELYRCDEASFAKVYKRLLRTLPQGSYDVHVRGVRLNEPLSSLGLGTPSELKQRCVDIVSDSEAERDNHDSGWDMHTRQQKRVIKSTRNPRRRKQSTPKAEARKGISFSGPENVLHVFKGTISCRRRGHVIESATGKITSLTGQDLTLNVNYCQNCGLYFLGLNEYQHYRELYGPVLGNFSFEGSWSVDGNGFGTLASESPLMLAGYSVSEAEGLTAKQRRLILANVMDRAILGKPRVIDYLQFFIRSRRNHPTMKSACEKWRADLAWVREYHINQQRRFTVSEVRRFR